jgi:hypothetical protein
MLVPTEMIIPEDVLVRLSWHCPATEKAPGFTEDVLVLMQDYP